MAKRRSLGASEPRHHGREGLVLAARQKRRARIAGEGLEQFRGDRHIGAHLLADRRIVGYRETAQIASVRAGSGKAHDIVAAALLAFDAEPSAGKFGPCDRARIRLDLQDIEQPAQGLAGIGDANRLHLHATVFGAPEIAHIGPAGIDHTTEGNENPRARGGIVDQRDTEAVLDRIGLVDEPAEHVVGDDTVRLHPVARLKIPDRPERARPDDAVERAVVIAGPGQTNLEALTKILVRLAVISLGQTHGLGSRDGQRGRQNSQPQNRHHRPRSAPHGIPLVIEHCHA